MKEELIKLLNEMKENLEKEDFNEEKVTKDAAINTVATIKILDSMKEGKTLVEASSSLVRSFDDALSKCLENGAAADDEFMYNFTTNYLNTQLGILSGLFSVKDIAKNRDNLAFLKSKVRECLVYIDRL